MRNPFRKPKPADIARELSAAYRDRIRRDKLAVARQIRDELGLPELDALK